MLVDLDDRVGRGDRHVDRVVAVQGLEAVADDPGADQGAYGVVEEHLGVVVRDRVERPHRGAVAGVGALEHVGDLGVAAVADDRVHGVEVPGRHHHHDLARRRGARRAAARVCSRIVWPAILTSCLGMSRPDAGADAAGQDHRDVCGRRARPPGAHRHAREGAGVGVTRSRSAGRGGAAYGVDDAGAAASVAVEERRGHPLGVLRERGGAGLDQVLDLADGVVELSWRRVRSRPGRTRSSRGCRRGCPRASAGCRTGSSTPAGRRRPRRRRSRSSR